MSDSGDNSDHGTAAVTLRLGREQLVIRRRYQAASVLNDFCIGVWFLIGSVLFFYPELVEAGTWLFVLGSAQLLVRPLIRLSHYVHLRRVPSGDWDF